MNPLKSNRTKCDSSDEDDEFIDLLFSPKNKTNLCVKSEESCKYSGDKKSIFILNFGFPVLIPVIYTEIVETVHNKVKVTVRKGTNNTHDIELSVLDHQKPTVKIEDVAYGTKLVEEHQKEIEARGEGVVQDETCSSQLLEASRRRSGRHR